MPKRWWRRLWKLHLAAIVRRFECTERLTPNGHTRDWQVFSRIHLLQRFCSRAILFFALICDHIFPGRAVHPAVDTALAVENAVLAANDRGIFVTLLNWARTPWSVNRNFVGSWESRRTKAFSLAQLAASL